MPSIPKKEVKSFVTSLLSDFLSTSNLSVLSSGIKECSVLEDAGDVAVTRTHLTSELTKVCAYSVCSLREEEGEKLCGALVTLLLNGVLSPGGLEHGLRVMAARLADVCLDYPTALASLTGFCAWLAQSEAIPETFLEEASLPQGALKAALEDSGDPGRGRAGMLTLSSALSTALHSRLPTQLAQLRALYKECVVHYLASGGAALDVTFSTLTALRARWTSHELVRKVLHVFIDPPTGTAAGEGGGDDQATHPPWLLRELSVDLITTLFAQGHIDSLSVSAACEATLRELPELTLDVPEAPVLLGAAIARLYAEGVLERGWVVAGKHASLGGLTLEGARLEVLEVTESKPPTPSPTQRVGAPLPYAAPPTPALGPLPHNTWAAGTTAARSSSGTEGGGGISPVRLGGGGSGGGGGAEAAGGGGGWETHAPLHEIDGFDLSAPPSTTTTATTTTTTQLPPPISLRPTVSTRRAAFRYSHTHTLQLAIKCLSTAAALVGEDGGSEEGRVAGHVRVKQLREMDLWGVRCRGKKEEGGGGEGSHLTFPELRVATHYQGQRFIERVLVEWGEDNLPSLPLSSTLTESARCAAASEGRPPHDTTSALAWEGVPAPSSSSLSTTPTPTPTSSPQTFLAQGEEAEREICAAFNSLGAVWCAALGNNLVATLALNLCNLAGTGGEGGELWVSLLARVHTVLSVLVNSGSLPRHALRRGLASALETAAAAASAGVLHKGALLSLPILLSRLGKEGALGATPLLPHALSPGMQGEEEEEDSLLFKLKALITF